VNDIDPTPAPTPASTVVSTLDRGGLLLGVGAYACWGILPIYFRTLKSVGPVVIVAQRILWSVVVLTILLTALRGWPAVRRALRQRRTTALLALSAMLIGTNWLIYIYAVNSGHILAASLGYYLNPLANILLGRFLLKEQLSRLQWAAVGIAAGGIALLAAHALGQLWISLVLCGSFACYGLARKVVAADALTGLAIETGFLLPVALTYLAFVHAPGAPWLASSPRISLLLIASCLVSTIPLLLFAAAARRLPYSTMGMLQFLAPTLQFLLAVFLYGEPFTRMHAIAFAAIWSALALYVVALVAGARRLRSEAETVMLSEC
jgi:chloramphenicol-sensitive protein RarD